MSLAVTEQQLSLLHHTLGLRPDRREPFRNHFVAGPGHYDQPDLEALDSAGMMKRGRAPSFCGQGDVVFHCTDAGRSYAIENLPQPPKYSRYDEYLQSECSEGFAWWLGINVPRVEWNYQWGGAAKYRYVRVDWQYRADVAGEWRPTKKEAKASYKEALRQRRAACQAFA